MNLSKKDQQLYDRLKHEIFSLETLQNFSLAQLAKELKITYYKALLWYSHMLKFYADHQRPPADHLYPTCGKQKNEVTDFSLCRDVFHYI